MVWCTCLSPCCFLQEDQSLVTVRGSPRSKPSHTATLLLQDHSDLIVMKEEPQADEVVLSQSFCLFVCLFVYLIVMEEEPDEMKSCCNLFVCLFVSLFDL